MFKIASLFFLGLVGSGFALPSLVFHHLHDGPRFQYATDSTGQNHLVDLAMTVEDLAEAAKYDPHRANIYHLFTRENPTQSQPLLINSPGLLQMTNFRNNRRTVVLIHGWRDSPTGDFVNVLVPAFLEAEDVNVIVLDWTAGSSSLSYREVITNTVQSGQAVAAFINWLNEETHSSPVQYHIVGHGFGGHQAGIAGRFVTGNVAYITGLDAGLIGWINHIDRLSPTDGLYTEAIHTNYGVNGYLGDLAQVDFYPNGGVSMPGCETNACDHARSYFYFAESLLSGGFTGRQCLNYFAAVLNTCDLLPGRLQMGGLRPKLGSSGVYLLETNAAPPFSQG